MNACHLRDSRYTNNEIFNQQIEVADVVVGNKKDLYQQGDEDRLLTYVRDKAASDVKVLFTSNGEIQSELLTGLAHYAEQIECDAHHHHSDTTVAVEEEMTECGYIKKVNQGEGYCSVGWRFREEAVFQRDELLSFLSGIDVERVKAVMNTETGVLGYNKVGDALSEIPLFGRGQSCIEIIGVTINEDWETQLLKCLARSLHSRTSRTTKQT